MKIEFLETNVSVTPEIENTLKSSITIQNLTLDMNLAMLEANIVKEPMKCKRSRAKLGKSSQHSLIENDANEFQNLCAQIVTLFMSVGDQIHYSIDGLKP